MIMDSGFYKDHECFSGADIVAEWDFVQGMSYSEHEKAILKTTAHLKPNHYTGLVMHIHSYN